MYAGIRTPAFLVVSLKVAQTPGKSSTLQFALYQLSSKNKHMLILI